MVTEDLINRIAARVAQNIGAGAAPSSTGNVLLLIFSGEIAPDSSLNSLLASIRDSQEKTGFSVRAVMSTRDDRALDYVKQSVHGVEFIAPDGLSESSSDLHQILDQTHLIVITDLTLPMAAKLVALQADVPIVNLCLQALLRRQRVLAITDGLGFAAGDVGAGLAPGLNRAIDELMNKLRSLGIELCRSDEAGPLLRPMSRSRSATVYPLPVLPRTGAVGMNQQHPSQELFNVPEEVAEFVDFLETRQCVLEPDKPCCGRGECRSRGF